MSEKKQLAALIKMGLIIGVFVCALFYVWQQIQVVRIGYAIDKLKGQIEETENQNKYLKIKLNAVCSLDRVEKIAKDKLKMIDPSPENIVYLEIKNN